MPPFAPLPDVPPAPSSDAILRLYARVRDLPWQRLELDGGTDGPAGFPYRLVGTLQGRRLSIALDPGRTPGADGWILEMSGAQAGPARPGLQLFERDDELVRFLERLTPDGP